MFFAISTSISSSTSVSKCIIADNTSPNAPLLWRICSFFAKSLLSSSSPYLLKIVWSNNQSETITKATAQGIEYLENPLASTMMQHLPFLSVCVIEPVTLSTIALASAALPIYQTPTNNAMGCVVAVSTKVRVLAQERYHSGTACGFSSKVSIRRSLSLLQCQCRERQIQTQPKETRRYPWPFRWHSLHRKQTSPSTPQAQKESNASKTTKTVQIHTNKSTPHVLIRRLLRSLQPSSIAV